MSSRTTGFPKSLRLTKASDHQQVFDSSRRFTDKCFLVLVRENTKTIARLGLAISKKHIHSAAQRNRVKRLIRESFRHHQEDLAGKDIVVLAQKRFLIKNNGVLRESLKTHWGKIKKCEKSC